MSEAKKRPYVEITPRDAREFFEAPDALAELKQDALFGERALGRHAINAIAKRGDLVGVVFAPDNTGTMQPAKVVNLGKDFGTPVHVDFEEKPFEDQYEPLSTAIQEEEALENMAAETVSIKREDIEALDDTPPVDLTETAGATQPADKDTMIEDQEEDVAPQNLTEDAKENTPEIRGSNKLDVDIQAELAPEGEITETTKVAPKAPPKNRSIMEALSGAEEEEIDEPQRAEEVEQYDFEKLALNDMEVAEVVSKVSTHVTEQLDAMSKATVEVASRFDEAYLKAFRTGYTIEQSEVLSALEDMKKMLGEHDARISDMQAETARYVEIEGDTSLTEEQDEEKRKYREMARETIEKISEQLSKMEEANSGALEVQRNLDSFLRDRAHLPYYSDMPIFRGATETANAIVKQLVETLATRSDRAKQIRPLLEDLDDLQKNLQTQE